MKYILLAILAWFLYQLLFKLVIPVYRTTRQIKKGFRDMQEKMQQQQQQAQTANAGTTPSPKPKVSPDDYIDFEEVK